MATYPYMHSLWTGLVFSYTVRFLLGHSDIHTPLLKLCRVKLTPLTLADVIDEPHRYFGLMFSVKGMCIDLKDSNPSFDNGLCFHKSGSVVTT